MIDRFKAKYVVAANGCHLWTANKSDKGYGRFKLRDGTQAAAHRIAWELAHGTIPNGLSVLHKCDVPACVNPDHLFLGTQDDNMKDMIRKGRSLRGALNGRAKLTADDVRSIRQSSGSDAEKARLYGVSEATVRHARIGRKWKSVSVVYASSPSTAGESIT